MSRKYSAVSRFGCVEVGVCGFLVPGSLTSIEVTLALLVAQVVSLLYYIF